jgi:hypothetical protein
MLELDLSRDGIFPNTLDEVVVAFTFAFGEALNAYSWFRRKD